MAADPTTEVAKAIYGKFARVSDPREIDRRWDRLKPVIQERFVEEASAAIATFTQITGR